MELFINILYGKKGDAFKAWQKAITRRRAESRQHKHWTGTKKSYGGGQGKSSGWTKRIFEHLVIHLFKTSSYPNTHSLLDMVHHLNRSVLKYILNATVLEATAQKRAVHCHLRCAGSTARSVNYKRCVSATVLRVLSVPQQKSMSQ